MRSVHAKGEIGQSVPTAKHSSFTGKRNTAKKNPIIERCSERTEPSGGRGEEKATELFHLLITL
jgi:hypothetical protein